MTTRPENQLNKVIGRLSALPAFLRLRGFDLVFGTFSRAYRTLGVRTVVLEPVRVEMTLKNRRRLRNHVGGIHGVICQAPAEYAAGVLVGHWVPRRAIVVVKTMAAELSRPVRGDIRAVAELPESALLPLMTQEKGELSVPVRIIDQTGGVPMTLDVTMAWFPKGSRQTAGSHGAATP